jgi:DNA polymerase III alpha subunit
MKLDKYNNPIFDPSDLFEAVYKGHTFDAHNTYIVNERTSDVINLEKEIGFKFLEPYETHFEYSEYDQACQQIWNMPDEYKQMDIEQWLKEQCPPWDPESSRLQDELDAYKARNMLDLLRWLKYFVDTCSKEGVVWGIGRGSSVASYVLYLIGVHNIDPIKHNLDWEEFLR